MNKKSEISKIFASGVGATCGQANDPASEVFSRGDYFSGSVRLYEY